jgi:hypothetical protein
MASTQREQNPNASTERAAEFLVLLANGTADALMDAHPELKAGINDFLRRHSGSAESQRTTAASNEVGHILRVDQEVDAAIKSFGNECGNAFKKVVKFAKYLIPGAMGLSALYLGASGAAAAKVVATAAAIGLDGVVGVAAIGAGIGTVYVGGMAAYRAAQLAYRTVALGIASLFRLKGKAAKQGCA